MIESAKQVLTPLFFLVSEEGMQVAGRYPESDQWIDDCNPSEWMAIVQQACEFIWQRIK